MLGEVRLVSREVTTEVDPRGHGGVCVPELVSDADQRCASLVQKRRDRTPEGVRYGPSDSNTIEHPPNCRGRVGLIPLLRTIQVCGRREDKPDAPVHRPTLNAIKQPVGQALNRPGSDGGSQSMEDASHGSTQEVRRRVA